MNYRRIGAVAILFLLAAFFLRSGSVVLADNESISRPLGLGSIAGTVRNQKGLPLSNIEVSAIATWNTYQPTIITTTTSLTGSYRIPLMPSGNYYLQFRDNHKIYGTQFYTYSQIVEESVKVQVMGDHQVGVDAILHLGGIITGVISIQGELPPPGTNIYVTLDMLQNETWYSADNAEVMTTTGHYASYAMLPGIYRVCANSYNAINFTYFSLCYPTEITVSAGVNIQNINFDLAESNYNGSIGGVVFGDGAPLSGIRVDLYNSYDPTASLIHTYTNSDGYYALSGLGGDDYALVFRDPKDAFATLRYSDTPPLIVPFGHYVPLFRNQHLDNLDITLPRAATITGTVWKSDGTPFPNVEVIAFWPLWGFDWQYTTLKARTDERGYYSLGGLLPGKYRLEFHSCSTTNNCERTEFFGAPENDFFSVYDATDIVVKSKQILTDINLTLGPDPHVYLPIIKR